MTSFTVDTPMRLDAFLVQAGGFVSRGRVQESIEGKLVTVNGVVVTKSSQKLRPGDVVAVTTVDAVVSDMKPDDLSLEILYEDTACFVINKPAGIAVHPGSGMEPGEVTILHGIAHLFEERGLPFTEASVLAHRIDKDTTGCLLVAKTAAAHLFLQKQFEDRTIRKYYLTIVAGQPIPGDAVIDSPIGRSNTDRTKMSVLGASRSREAKTTYRTLDTTGSASLLLCELHTGRTHQIRVHMRTIGHSILGDATYATSSALQLSQQYAVDSLCLHAWRIAFVSPADKKEHIVTAPLPSAFKGVLKRAGLKEKKA